jgi:hypothetical protein
MPMIDVHAAEGTFADTHRLAEAAGDPSYAEGGGGIADLARAALGSC